MIDTGVQEKTSYTPAPVQEKSEITERQESLRNKKIARVPNSYQELTKIRKQGESQLAWLQPIYQKAFEILDPRAVGDENAHFGAMITTLAAVDKETMDRNFFSSRIMSLSGHFGLLSQEMLDDPVQLAAADKGLYKVLRDYMITKYHLPKVESFAELYALVRDLVSKRGVGDLQAWAYRNRIPLIKSLYSDRSMGESVAREIDILTAFNKGPYTLELSNSFFADSNTLTTVYNLVEKGEYRKAYTFFNNELNDQGIWLSRKTRQDIIYGGTMYDSKSGRAKIFIDEDFEKLSPESQLFYLQHAYKSILLRKRGLRTNNEYLEQLMRTDYDFLKRLFISGYDWHEIMERSGDITMRLINLNQRMREER